MELVYLFIGLSIGIMFGFMLGDRNRQKSSTTTEFAQLLKQASESLGKDESVSVSITTEKYSQDDDGEDDGDFPFDIEPRLLDKWMEN